MPAIKLKAAGEINAEPAVAATAGDSFIPLRSLQNALRFWWLIFVLMVAGGLFGFFMSSVRPPLYEATGRFPISIDFVSTGPMTQYEEDVALNAVAAVLYSSQLIDDIVARAVEQGISTSAAELRAAAVLERKVSDWDLRLRMTDPVRAGQLASLWIDLGQEKLQERFRNAQEAENLRRVLRSLENCLQQASVSEPAVPSCTAERLPEIQADLERVGQAYIEALAGSQSISPALRIGPAVYTGVSTRPVMHDRGLLVLAGSMLGFLLGISLISLGLPARWMK